MNKRSSFSGKLGFVLAAAGSAVGLGNIWRFPYLAAQYGGGTFLLIYLILAVTFGFSLMIAEVAIGRKTGLSAIGAFKALDSRFGFLCDAVTLWCFTVPVGFLMAFVWKCPVLLVYFVINLDEIVKLPAVYRRYRRYLWLKDLTVKD